MAVFCIELEILVIIYFYGFLSLDYILKILEKANTNTLILLQKKYILNTGKWDIQLEPETKKKVAFLFYYNMLVI